jgi:Putative zinc-finger
MKCNDCLNLLAEYLDGEVVDHEAEQINAHLMFCTACAGEFEALTAEQELFGRYDREVNIAPAMWEAIQARTAVEMRPVKASSKTRSLGWFGGLFAAPRIGLAFAGAMAVLLAAVAIGIVYLKTHQPGPSATLSAATTPGTLPPPPIYQAGTKPPNNGGLSAPTLTATVNHPVKSPLRSNGAVIKTASLNDQNDVLFRDVADIEDKETAEHVQQAENLLKSIRNLQLAEGDDEVDVTYEKTESRRLLNENVVLRRDAEMAGKFPVKTLLGSLEPFLIDIANLPDKTTPTELRQIKDRVQKTEIVAALQGY